MRFTLLFALCAALLAGQSKPPAKPAPAATSSEDQDLERALSESGSSPVEYARALERHLLKYPNSERRAEMERVLAQASIEMRDKRRILLYGVPAIEGGSRNPQVLDFTTRTLLDQTDKPSHERALKYSRLLAEAMDAQRQSQIAAKEFTSSRGRRLDETEFAIARARTFEARALGELGLFDEALQAATQGWTLYPTRENARERARLLERARKPSAALAAFAEALALADERAEPGDPAKERARLADLSTKATGSDSGFGPALLAAYDRVAALRAAREKRLREFDPNLSARAPLDFTLSGVEGGALDMASLKGKVVIIDFWATWCGPCRAQHPLYEQAKKRFKDRSDVVFLAVSTDEDRSAVVPFLEANKWSKQVWFEDGLATLLRVSSIPTTVILDRQGAITSRLNGFIADRFVDMLSDRINEALGDSK
ncbi:MAG: TlpA family protein disulfide reductase [Acidobacteria bacterium]|nr:TlpA family protein disulfide reductase [Acidobacteriota bacterium]